MAIHIDNDKWGDWGGLERIDINVDAPVKVDRTILRDKCTNEWIKYDVATEIDGQGRYHIVYTEKNNFHLFDPVSRTHFRKGDGNFIPGEHILILEENQDSGESIWIPEDGEKYDGPGWIKVQENLVGDRRRITSKKLQRAQDEFRNMLLAYDDRRCALTGETCPEALEAVHIIPVKSRGQEVLPNGILLRADLHRIYDAGHFDICPETGKIIVNRLLVDKPYKSFDLMNAQIEEGILSRIAGALRERADLCPARQRPDNPAWRAHR